VTAKLIDGKAIAQEVRDEVAAAVAKRVAVIHGGYVWVTSDEVEGTTFFAAIPATAQNRG